MKKLVSISVLMIVLAALAVNSPAAGETYDLTLTPLNADVSGFLIHSSSGQADDALANALLNILGFVPSNFPSGDYKFSAFWRFQSDSAMSPLVAGSSYQLSWDWKDVLFYVAPSFWGTFDYSAAYLAMAEEQTASGANYMVAAMTNAADTLSIAGIFEEGSNYNVFAFTSAEVPSGINLPSGFDKNSAPISRIGYNGNTAGGTLDVNAVPIPGSLLLLASGLLGLAACSWRKALSML